MASETCEACGEDVPISGGIGSIWSSKNKQTGGMALELADGSEFFLCYDCMDRLPDDRDVTADDVEALQET